MDGFIVVGNTNAVTYKEVFPLFKANKVRLGYTANRALLCKLPEDAEDYLKIDEDGDVFMTNEVEGVFASAEKLWKKGYGIAVEEWIVGDGNPLKGKVIIEYIK